MDPNKEKAIHTLNDLIEYCKDGQYGYHTAAEDVKNTELQSLFNNYSQQRAKFADQLKETVRTLGGDPDTGGSIRGTIHRGWIDIKSAVSGGDEKAIIAECERGDSAAVEAYEKAMQTELPQQAHEIVRRQYSELKNAFGQIHILHETKD